MASLIEELIDTLNLENDEYGKLLELSTQKAAAIVARNISAIEKITDDEQIVLTTIGNLDAKRAQVTSDIADVINKDVETLKLSVLIDLLAKQPGEQKRLSQVHDRLKVTVDNVRRINESNRQLIEQSLEMVEFDINMLKAMRQAPETNNYGRGAVSVGETLGSVRGFDAKQ